MHARASGHPKDRDLTDMHILVISSEPYLIPTVPLGGIFQQHQVDALRRSGLDVGVASGGVLPLRDLLSFRGRPLLEPQVNALVVRRFSKSYLPLRFMDQRRLHDKNTRELVRAVEIYIREKGRPDCLHAHNLQYAGMATLEIAEKYGIPYVLTEHSSSFVTGTYPASLHQRFVEVVARSACNIAVSSSLADRMNQIFAGLSHPFTVVPNVIDLDFVPRPPVDADSEPFTFLSIGRLDVNKNHELLIRAFADAFRGTSTLLRVGGSGHEEARLRELAKTLGVDGQIRFLGFLSREQVAAELGAAHCFVLPSIKETFGVVVIEALACAVPVIATPSGGPSDIVQDSNGIMTADHSVAAMTRALKEMRERYSEFDRAFIRTDALARFSPDAFSKTMSAVYQNVLRDTAQDAARDMLCRAESHIL